MSLVVDDIISLIWSSTDGSFPSSIILGETKSYKVVDANTLEQIDETLSDAGTGNHTLTPFMDYSVRVSNTIAFGEQARVNHTGQIKIGSESYEDIDILTANGGFGMDNSGYKYWTDSETGAFDGTAVKYIGVDSTGTQITVDASALTNTPVTGDPNEVSYFDASGNPAHSNVFTYNGSTLSVTSVAAVPAGYFNSVGAGIYAETLTSNPMLSAGLFRRSGEGSILELQSGSQIANVILGFNNPNGVFTADAGSTMHNLISGEMYLKQSTADDQNWNKVFVEKYDMSFNAEVSQTAHGFSGITALYHNGTSYVQADGSLAASAADTIFITSKDANTMVLAANGILQASAHGLTIGEWYCLNPAGTGLVLESSLTTGDNKQYILFVLDGNQLQLNLQPLDVVI